MKKLLELNTEGLFTQELEYACPSKASIESGSKILATRRDWTGDTAKGAIHSGYRRQILSREGLAESLALAAQLRAQFDTMLVLGIGGSALGARTALSALSWQVSAHQRKQVFVADNLDPVEFEIIWSKLDLKRTCFALITKSGGTIETMAQASVVLDRLKRAGLDFKNHLVAVTDPKEGQLRKWVDREKLMNLPVPPDVGGRYSVLTPVGILPIAFAGIDAKQLLEGACAQFENRIISEELIGAMAVRLAELEEGGFAGQVILPYATMLKDFGAWFVQLWGESLGKERADGSAHGALPIAAVGATDQHSLLQMLVEGPNRVVNGFVKVKDWKTSQFPMPKMETLPEEFTALKYAHGKTFAEILNAEGKATATVLRQRGRPVYELEIASISPESLGALFAFYMDLVAAIGAASQVNPFNQPGVELGKKILPDLLRG